MEKTHRTEPPWAVLGVAEDAPLEELRAAYLRAVREHPPDRDPDAFEAIRDAYEAMRDPLRRTQQLLFSADPAAPLERLLDDHPARRRHVGPGPWIRALRERC